MNWRVKCFIFFLFFFTENLIVFVTQGNSRVVSDAAEVHNIAWNLAHGKGYRFDWSDKAWRDLWLSKNASGMFDSLLVRSGSAPTMSRPPLMPLLVALLIKVSPTYSFIAWRLVDSTFFALAACLLCEVAYKFGSYFAVAVMLLLLAADPLRRDFVPSWWTEGLAFDCVVVLSWLISCGKTVKPFRYLLVAGLSLGALSLDRGIFALLYVPIAVLMACNATNRLSFNAKIGIGIFIVATIVQLPWWIRNVEVSGQILPLGTQGGFNLPAEYGDVAVRNRGEWTEFGLPYAWYWTNMGKFKNTIPLGLSESDFEKRCVENPAVLSAVTSTYPSEVVLCNAGKHFAEAWIIENYRKLPILMAMKAYTLTRAERRPLFFAVLISIAAIIGTQLEKRTAALLTTFILVYILGIAATHVVLYRFLIPMLPPIYILVVIGSTAAVRHLRQMPPKHFANHFAGTSINSKNI